MVRFDKFNFDLKAERARTTNFGVLLMLANLLKFANINRARTFVDLQYPVYPKPLSSNLILLLCLFFLAAMDYNGLDVDTVLHASSR